MSQARILDILTEILPVIGTIGLLGLWLYQQTTIEQRGNELRKLSSARGVYQTYQSHNAVFNAIRETIDGNKKAETQLRVFQQYNYELGLSAIEAVLSDQDKADIPPAPIVYGATEDTDARMERTQKRLELLQDRLSKKEASIGREAESERKRYLWWYIALSFISILGAALKIVAKFSHPASLN